MTKHKKSIITSLVLLIIVTVVIFWVNNRSNPQQPFSDLSVSDIYSISVYAIPPDKAIMVNDVEQTEAIVQILRTVVVYEKSNAWKKSSGQGVYFTVNKTSGEVVVVRPYGLHLIIDGQGYKTEYQPSENLNRIANTLLDTPFGGRPIE